MADRGAVGYAGDIVTRGFGLLSRAVGMLFAENYVGRERQYADRPQDRPPEALEPGPLAGPDAEPENAHRVNGAPAVAAAAPGVVDGTAAATERARMAARSRYAFAIFMSLAFLAGFGAGMCWGAATAPVSGDSSATPAVADAPKFRVTFNVEGHTAEDIKFRLNMISDPVQPPPSREWAGWDFLRSVSEQVAITARTVSERATVPPRLAYSLLRGMVTSYGGDTGSSGSSGGGGSSSSGGGEWPGWDFLLRSVSEQAAVTARHAHAFFDWMTTSNGYDTGSSSSSSGSSSSDKKSSPSTHTDGGNWANPFKAVNSWRAKHRDAAEEFGDGALV